MKNVMKFIPTFPVILFFLSFVLMSFNSEANKKQKFAQFIIDDASTVEDYKAIERHVRMQAGVLKAQIDRETGILFCLFAEGGHIDETTFAHWLSQKGYTLSCYREGIDGVDPIWGEELLQCM